MTKYLVGLFLAGSKNMPNEKFDKLMTEKLVDYKVQVYAAMPKSERPDHKYLIEVKAKKTKKSLEQQYLAGDIDLTTYSDEKYPERAEKHRARRATYPLPESKFMCIICAKPLCATIKCMECENRACKECVTSAFGSSDVTSPAAFVLLHHTYCLKLGRPIIRKVAVPGGKGGASSRPRPG